MKLKILLILLLSVVSTTGHTLTSTKESRADDALTCTGLFYIMTSIPEPEELNHLYTKLVMIMREIYANLESDKQNKSLSNGEISKAKDKAALKLGKLYDKYPEKVVDEYIQCNAWRADIAKHLIKKTYKKELKNDEIDRIFRSVPIPKKLKDISLSKERKNASKNQVILGMKEWGEFGRITPQDYKAYLYSFLKKPKPSVTKGENEYDKGKNEYNKGNYKEANNWFRKAADQGYADYHDGLDDYKRGDYQTALKKWRRLANLGWNNAEYNLGVMYEKGRGVAQDYKQAVRWYRKAGDDQGEVLLIDPPVAEAQYNLGVLYAGGKGVAQDDKQAVKWYRKAADQGYADAQYNLALMYDKGKGVSQDYKQAVKWYRKAADQGDADAQTSLGWMYANGQGVSQDYKQALRWYRKAADQGDASAQSELGLMYLNGNGVAQDDKQALRWYRKAAEQGNSRAQFGLGLIYGKGKGVLRDPKQAVNWYQKAAEQGYSRAQYNLGVMYTDQGGLKDMTKAKYWIKKAYEGDDAKISKYAEQRWNVYELWKY